MQNKLRTFLGSEMAHDGRAIANWVLDAAEKDGINLSNLSLQKVLFFCHAWHLVETGEPLIHHRFEAWQHGPVLQFLYRQFKSFGSDPIRSRATGLNRKTGTQEVIRAEIPSDVQERLRRVVRFYGKLQPWDLVDLSHEAGSPWDQVWHFEGKVNPGMKIENEAILEYYSKASPHYRVQ